jgi:oxygen-independent coproporphyrinogen-3 oxidase
VSNTSLAFYIHVPFCLRRCGYCDFNTYTPAELKIAAELPGISKTYIDQVLKELEVAVAQTGGRHIPSIFFGGGTPSLMSPTDLARLIKAIGSNYQIDDDCEITLEANPDTVTMARLSEYRAAGINRISFGMQSAVPHVLAALDRSHDPAQVQRALEWAKAAGIAQRSVDLIFGGDGESLADWQHSLESALALPITHISAYALIVEEGTKLGRQVARGEVSPPDDDLLADKYLLAEELIHRHGLPWYEVSNWGEPSRHNLNYWRGGEWWGLGPGAHSHIGGRRFHNVKHPNTYASKLASGVSVIAEEEILTDSAKFEEAMMLGVRIRRGLQISALTPVQIAKLQDFRASGEIDEQDWTAGYLTLTPIGRLRADLILRAALLEIN